MAYRRMVTQGRIIFALFLSFALSAATVQVIGTYMPALADEFDVGPAVLGWICSLGLAVLCLAGPGAGVVINKVEPRWVVMMGGFIQAMGLMSTYLATSTMLLYIGFGLLNGIGASFVYVSAPINIAAYFNSFYTTAVGVVFPGVGVGIFALSPLIETLIELYGWRGAAVIHGALVFYVVALGAMLPLRKCCKTGTSTNVKHKEPQYRKISENTDEAREKEDSKSDEAFQRSDEITLKAPETKWYLTYVQLFTSSPTIVLIYLVVFFLNLAYAAGLTHAYNQVIMSGYSKNQGALTLSLLGAGSLLGRVLHGVPIDAGVMLPSTLYAISLFAAALVTFINPLANNFLGFIVSATGLGFLSGILYPLLYTIMKRKVGTSLLAPAVGLELLLDGLGVMAGGYLAGAIQQISGDYRLSFYTTGATLLLATCLFLPICLTERKVTWMALPTKKAEAATNV